MIKKLMIVLFASVLFISCASNTQKTETSEAETVTEITVSDFETKAGDLIGKPVMLTATINHICKHGGKKMFLVEEGSETSVKVVPNESMAAFNTDYEGNQVKVEGIVEALIIDEEYLMTWESELMAGKEEKKEHESGDCEAEDKTEHSSAYESIASYRKEMAEKGTDRLAFYSIICNNFEIIKAKETEE